MAMQDERCAHAVRRRRDAAQPGALRWPVPSRERAPVMLLSCGRAETTDVPTPLPESPVPFAPPDRLQSSVLSGTSSAAMYRTRENAVSFPLDRAAQSNL